MGRKKKRRSRKMKYLQLDPNNKDVLNRQEPFIEEDFKHDLPGNVMDLVLYYLNKLRTQYVPFYYAKDKAKDPIVNQKILDKRAKVTSEMERRAEAMLEFANIKILKR